MSQTRQKERGRGRLQDHKEGEARTGVTEKRLDSEKKKSYRQIKGL